jgi:hypothetical protein
VRFVRKLVKISFYSYSDFQSMLSSEPTTTTAVTVMIIFVNFYFEISSNSTIFVVIIA